MPGQALEVWQDATKFYSKSYLGWPTYIDLLMSALSSPNLYTGPQSDHMKMGKELLKFARGR